jgi:hypothetical protein
MTRAFWNPICAYHLNKVLKTGTLPRKQLRQKQYQQSSKRRYSRDKMQIDRIPFFIN